MALADGRSTGAPACVSCIMSKRFEVIQTIDISTSHHTNKQFGAQAVDVVVAPSLFLFFFSCGELNQITVIISNEVTKTAKLHGKDVNG